MRELSERWGAAEQQILSLFFQGVEQSIFRLEWSDTCPSCKAEEPSGDIYSRTQTCTACGCEFRPCADIHRIGHFSVHPLVYQDQILKKTGRQKSRPGVRAIDCLMTPEFRCGQGFGLIPPGTCLDIREASVLYFTDTGLRGLFDIEDDASAFAEGYRRLSVVDSCVRNAGGSVFRYAHDTAVALFTETLYAVDAGVNIRAIEAKAGGTPRGVISIHSGPVIAVNYGEKVGFSGRTIADLAVVHSKLMHPHISLSGRAYKDGKAAALFNSHTRGRSRIKIVLKASGRELEMFRGR